MLVSPGLSESYKSFTSHRHIDWWRMRWILCGWADPVLVARLWLFPFSLPVPPLPGIDYPRLHGNHCQREANGRRTWDLQIWEDNVEQWEGVEGWRWCGWRQMVVVAVTWRGLASSLILPGCQQSFWVVTIFF